MNPVFQAWKGCTVFNPRNRNMMISHVLLKN